MAPFNVLHVFLCFNISLLLLPVIPFRASNDSIEHLQLPTACSIAFVNLTFDSPSELR